MVYENFDGSLVKVTESTSGFDKTIVLCNTKRYFHNREIRVEVLDNKLYIYFTTSYKKKKMILFLGENLSPYIFDYLDEKRFLTLATGKNEIILCYKKYGIYGYRIQTVHGIGKFTPMPITNPLKLLEFDAKIYCLYQEKSYFLYNLTDKKKISLPLVFYKKPFLYESDGYIYVRYRFYQKNIIYRLEENEIVFYEESYHLDESNKI